MANPITKCKMQMDEEAAAVKAAGKDCPVCKKNFKPKSHLQLYCTKACRTNKAPRTKREPSSTTPARKYAIRYGMVKATELSTMCLVWKYPAYGEPIGIHGSKPVKPSMHARTFKRNFYANLIDSIRTGGVKNPIFCITHEGITYSNYGMSRLWVAQTYDLEIPVIICDYDGVWSDLEELFTEKDCLDKYDGSICLYMSLTDDEMQISPGPLE